MQMGRKLKRTTFSFLTLDAATTCGKKELFYHIDEKFRQTMKSGDNSSMCCLLTIDVGERELLTE